MCARQLRQHERTGASKPAGFCAARPGASASRLSQAARPGESAGAVGRGALTALSVSLLHRTANFDILCQFSRQQAVRTFTSCGTGLKALELDFQILQVFDSKFMQ
jgi:hypothetical protein